MSDIVTTTISPTRLRIGVLLIAIWWVPIWLLAPSIANLLQPSPSPHFVAVVTAVIAIIQTIIGFLGVVIAGKSAKPIIRQTPKRQIPGKLWSVLIHGTFEPQ